VCLNSIRALNNPTWSLIDDFQQLFSALRKVISDVRRPRSEIAVRTA
jgi:hypothetical protein